MANSDDKRALFGGVTGDGASSKYQKAKPKQDALGNKIPEPEEELRLVDREIAELKIAFEQFFLGMDRKSPVRRRDMLWERFRRMKNNEAVMTTGLKFAFEHAQAKFAAFDRMWSRTLSEMESGTYSRDLYKMKLRGGGRPAGSSATPVSRAIPASNSAAALTEGQIKVLYDTYLVARRRTNEPTDNVTLDGLGKTLNKQVPQLLKQFECQAVDFKVIIKNGKAMIKAVPRK